MFEQEILPWVIENIQNKSRVLFLIDPSNNREQSVAKRTTTTIILSAGYRAIQCKLGRLLNPRIEAVKWHMYNELMEVSHECPKLIAALTADYHYKAGKRVPEQNHDQNSAPDLCAALEYVCIYLRSQSGFNYKGSRGFASIQDGDYSIETLKEDYENELAISAVA
jgi:hypothetical protein